jgi:hypothetical protein
VIDVPTEVRQKAAARGAEGARWLRDLGGVIEQLERDWELIRVFGLPETLRP